MDTHALPPSPSKHVQLSILPDPFSPFKHLKPDDSDTTVMSSSELSVSSRLPSLQQSHYFCEK